VVGSDLPAPQLASWACHLASVAAPRYQVVGNHWERR
jgi:hypothetical protein